MNSSIYTMEMISFPLTALKSPAAFHEQIKSLERARVRNLSLKCSPSLLYFKVPVDQVVTLLPHMSVEKMQCIFRTHGKQGNIFWGSFILEVCRKYVMFTFCSFKTSNNFCTYRTHHTSSLSCLQGLTTVFRIIME